MLSTKETPKKLAAVLEQKNSSCCWIAVDFVSVYSKCKATKFSTYPRRTYFNFPGRKVLRNGFWKNFYQKIWDFTFPSYFSRVCSTCALKFRNAVELVHFLFLDSEITTGFVVTRLWKPKHRQKRIKIHQSQPASMT